MLRPLRFRNGFLSKNNYFKLGIVLCWIGWAVFFSLKVSINIPTAHIDGAFQTASGLYRLDAGQFPGKDFYPYLGIGPLLVLYPFFEAFGANMSASVFSAQCMIFIVGVLSTALIWHLIWRPKSFITSLLAGSILFLVPIALAGFLSLSLPIWMKFYASPGPSLRPIRAAAPYLAAIVYYFFIFKIDSPQKKYVFSGLLTGSILLWSNDFAIPTASLFAFFLLANALRCNELQIRNVLVYLVVCLLSWVTLLTFATHGHPVELLKYNFHDVAHDQWWYFGQHQESSRIFNLLQLTRLFSQINNIPLFALALALIGIIAFRTRLIEHALLFWLGATLFAGGAVASVGGHLESGYFGGLYFWGMMSTCVGFCRWVWPGFRKIVADKLQVKIVSGLFLLGISLFLTIDSLNKLGSELYSAKNDPNRFFVPELGGYLKNEWKSYINLAKNTEDVGVYEEYWGLWSATRKTFPGWPVDSVIHALGSTRGTAVKKLQDANVIISTKYSTSPKFQPWNLSANYWLYEVLLRDWTPSFRSPTTIIWRKSGHSRQFKDVECSIVNKGSQSLILHAQDPGFYEVEMQYSHSGSGRFLAIVRNNISFPADHNGYISIDPNSTRVKFPVYAERAGANSLDTKVIGNMNINLEIKSCTAKFIPSIDDEVLHVPRTVGDGFFLTDKSWLHGVARSWAGFFVPNTPQFTNEYKVGRLVKIYAGEIREIIRTEPNGRYLNIYLKGDPLDPEKAGLPTKFVVLDKAVQIPNE